MHTIKIWFSNKNLCHYFILKINADNTYFTKAQMTKIRIRIHNVTTLQYGNEISVFFKKYCVAEMKRIQNLMKFKIRI